MTAIIGILASLLLGAVGRAYARVKRFEWEQNSWGFISRFRDRMRTDFGRMPQYPALTADQMYEGNLIDSTVRDFLKDKRVHFTPFSSQTPTNAPILYVEFNKNSGYLMLKEEIVPRD